MIAIWETSNFQLPGGYYVKPFPTVHRVTSQGYIVYRNHRKLKPEYTGLPGQEIGKLARDGVQIYNYVDSPEIAYTGIVKGNISQFISFHFHCSIIMK